MAEQEIFRQVTCTRCKKSMYLDIGSQALMCPYCGSNEFILHSDAVEIQRLKSTEHVTTEAIRQSANVARTELETDATRDIELAKIDKELELERLKAEKESKKRKGDNIVELCILVFLLIFFILLFMYMK